MLRPARGAAALPSLATGHSTRFYEGQALPPEQVRATGPDDD